jgi:gamma-glutamyltranspeptidase/glutathione hydrolase
MAVTPTTTVRAPSGMVASVDHLASSAGVHLLRSGGSAADAAIAAGAVLAVTAPNYCGMGGDLFALVHLPGRKAPEALNAAGRAGSGVDAAALRAEGHTTMPFRGDLRSAPVPGCVDGWLALHERYGRAPLREVLAPAYAYARGGFPASPALAAMVSLIAGVPGAGPLAEPMRRGQRVVRPGVADALEAIVADGRDGFYGGSFGAGLLAIGDGVYAADDFAVPLAEWVEPLRQRVWEHDVWTVPPCSQGYLVLLGAAVAEGLDLPDDPADGAWAHLLVEAARVAAHDRIDVLHEHADVRPLLDAGEVARRRALVDPAHRSALRAPAASGDTMYLCVVDADGMGVSYIQSNASGFGSHVFEPSTGIGLHNRGLGFSLVPGHPAEAGPGRRPPHTLAPALVTRPDGSLRAVVGTMGGDSQPQILLQLLTRLLRHGKHAGAVIGAPRWVLSSGSAHGFDTWVEPDQVTVAVEEDAGPGWAAGLRDRGHAVEVVNGLAGGFGHAQLIEVGDDGMRVGAADPRAIVGAAIGY